MHRAIDQQRLYHKAQVDGRVVMFNVIQDLDGVIYGNCNGNNTRDVAPFARLGR
jgi:hypothetical protein